MKKVLRGLALCALVVLISADFALHAQWVENGIPICNATGDQDTIAVIADDSGGSIIVWQDFRAGNWDIYAQRVDGYGRALWTANGVPVCTLAGAQQYPQVVPDGQGGAIILYVYRPGILDQVLVQRLDSGGASLWAPGGVQVCTVADSLLSVQMVADGAAGAIVTWQDIRVDTLGLDIYAQKVGSGGALQWGVAGVVICNAEEMQLDPHLVSDGSGGAIIAWTDWRSVSGPDPSNADIYAQRIDAAGIVQWPMNGQPVCTSVHKQSSARLATDEAGGAIVAWVDSRTGISEDICAQRIYSDGTPAWTANGIPVCDAANMQVDPLIVPDGAGGAIIVWQDGRSTWAVYAQRVDQNGNAKWVVNGSRVAVPDVEASIGIVSNGIGGVIVTWREGPYPDIFAQMLEGSAGSAKWGTNGVAICSAMDFQVGPQIASDGEGGAIIAWADNRDGNYDVYSQRVERNGYWGYPAPEIYAVRDVPGDQGSKVNLAWKASRLDPWPIQAILNYSIWMAIKPTAAVSLIENGATIVRDPSANLALAVNAVRIEQLGGRTFYWKLIGYLYASYLDSYSEHVQTLFDSTAVCTEYHYFQVIANESGTKGYWISAPDSGYSVDNLAPTIPCGIAGRQAGYDLRITWHPNAEKDLSHYALYRDTTEDFVPQTPILTSTDTVAIDTLWSPSSNNYYYKLIAFDIHGNASAPALLRPATIVATLLQGFSHSFGSSGIRIVWRLAECDPDVDFIVSRAGAPSSEFTELADVSIERDGLSFAFVDGAFEPGSTYRYRVEASDSRGRLMLFETGPISTPPMPLVLYQNRPNPFNPSTVIRYYLPEVSRVTLDVYDISGRRVARLIEKEQRAGVHEAVWNGRDNLGGSVSSGVYFYRLKAGKESITRKMILMR